MIDLEQHFAANHQFGQFGWRCLSGFEMRHHFTAPHHRDIVCDCHYFFQLMGDQQDGYTLFAKRPQNVKKLFGFLWGQDACWLIKYENFGTAEQRF